MLQSKTTSIIKAEFSDILGVKESSDLGLYLRMPSIVKYSKEVIFEGARDRIRRALQRWEGRLLSAAGREVLIKAVLQAIPTYLMSYFRVPETVVQELQMECNKFLWGTKGEKKCIHWLSQMGLSYQQTLVAIRHIFGEASGRRYHY